MLTAGANGADQEGNCSHPQLRGSGHSLARDARGHRKLRHTSGGEDAPLQGRRRNIFVFMHTNNFNNDPFYSNGASARFAETTNDTGEVVALAVRLGERLWRDGFRYSKTGIMITELLGQRVPSDAGDLDSN